MSSSVSGFYTITEVIHDRIYAQAMQELKVLNNLEDQSNSLEAQYNAHVQKREQHESERRQQENAVNVHAQEEHIYAAERLKALQMEASVLLAEAGERLERLTDTAPEKTALLEKLQCLENSVELFGVTDTTIQNIREYVRETVPQTMMRVYQQQEKERLEETAEALLKSAPAIHEESKDFVSLQIAAQQRMIKADPWPAFVERVEKLAQLQLEYGGFGADELLEEIQTVSEAQHALFMLQNESNVAMWEAEIEPMVQESADRTACFKEYLQLHSYCTALGMELPLLSKTASNEKLRKEHERLLALYLDHQNQRYLEKNFREVFEAHGLLFEGMKADQQNLEIEFGMDAESYIRVSRSATGAFEMLFVSRSSGESANERRRATEKAQSFCSLMPEIYADLAARGIHFEERVHQEPEDATVVFENSLQTIRRHEKKLQQMYLN